MTEQEQLLRKALDRAPDAPATEGFGALLADRARRRRTRRQAAFAVGSVLVSVAVVFGLASLPNSSDDPLPPLVSTPTPPAVEPLDCTEPPAQSVVGEPVVPTGAVEAVLCGGRVDNGGFNMEWPHDVLEAGLVDRLVERVNGLTPYIDQPSCQAVLGYTFELALRYTDGSTVWLEGDTSGNCESLVVEGGDAWKGAYEVLRLTRNLVAQSRVPSGDATIPRPAECPVSWQDVSYTHGADPVSSDSAVAITACRYELDHKRRFITQSSQGALIKHVVVENPRPLVREIESGSRVDPCDGVNYDLESVEDVLLVRDVWGDVQVVSTAPCWPSTATGSRLYPSENLAEQVSALLDG